ncbi:MAG: hypothetical protein LIO71_06305 [Ruminococcus sp.]|nr:hypothetical protein [Ruminococcus sp.]MCD7800194.1 hypothetical protein [Ruminococcus sp.]
MTTLIKRMLYLLCVVLIVSGAIMLFSGIGDCTKIVSTEPLDINDVDSSKFHDGILVSGDIYYVIDSVATSYSTELFSNSKIIYYLVPIKSGKYVLVATGNTNEINTLDRIFQQTCQYLNQEIEDTFTSLNIDGKVFPLDDELKDFLYSWAETTNYFSTTDQSLIDEEVLPYVIHTQSWKNIKVITAVGLITMLLGIIGFIIVHKKLIVKG